MSDTPTSSLLRRFEDVESARELIREADAAVVVFRNGSDLGWLTLGELDAVDILLLVEAADDIRRQYAEYLLSSGDSCRDGDDDDEDEERLEL